MRTVVVIILLSTISTYCASQNYFEFEISGKATNHWNGVPIPHALIELKLKDSLLATTLTNNAGEYSLQPVLLDTNKFYNIFVTHERFQGYGAGFWPERHNPGKVTTDISVYPSTSHFDATLAEEDLELGKLMIIDRGYHTTSIYTRCLETIWEKYGVEVSDGGFQYECMSMPNIDAYNEVMFKHLDSIYGRQWRAEKDSLLRACETENPCGVDYSKWNLYSAVNNQYYPGLSYDHNSINPDDTSKCILSTFYKDNILVEVQKDSFRLLIICGEDQLEKDGIYLERCKATKKFLLDLGYNTEQVEVSTEMIRTYWCHDQSLEECGQEIRKRNRVSAIWVLDKDDNYVLIK